jgi:hypothetical protein
MGAVLVFLKGMLVDGTLLSAFQGLKGIIAAKKAKKAGKWSELADLNGDGKIDMEDMKLIAPQVKVWMDEVRANPDKALWMKVLQITGAAVTWYLAVKFGIIF